MRTCWLEFSPEEGPEHWEVSVPGRATISSGTDCTGRRLPRFRCMDKGPRRRLRIGELIESGGTCRAADLYAAEDIGPAGFGEMKDHSGRLFS